jgi:regulatory protein
LLRAGFGPSEVEDALDGLEAVGLIDDERFAQAVVEHAVGVRLSGRRAVMAKLLSQGVPREVAERAVLESAGDERLQAEELARRRAGRLAGLDSAVAFRRLSEFLVRRGYGMGVAREAARRALALDQSVEE